MNGKCKTMPNTTVPPCLCDSVLKKEGYEGVGVFLNTEARRHRGTEMGVR